MLREPLGRTTHLFCLSTGETYTSVAMIDLPSDAARASQPDNLPFPSYGRQGLPIQCGLDLPVDAGESPLAPQSFTFPSYVQ